MYISVVELFEWNYRQMNLDLRRPVLLVQLDQVSPEVLSRLVLELGLEDLEFQADRVTEG